MKKFVFSLERMHNYKEQILRKEKNTLLRLRQRRQSIMDEIARLEAFRQLKKAEMHERQCTGMQATELSSYRFYLENIRLQLKGLAVELKRAEAEVERQLRIVVTATRELSGLDKLKEKQLEEYQLLETRQAEIDMLEYVSINIIRNRETDDSVQH